MERLTAKESKKPLITDEIREQLELVSDLLGWGTNGSKSIETLYSEVESGESTLSIDENGEIIRNLSFVGIDVYFMAWDKIYRLREDRQEFLDGSVKIRESNGEGIFEKMKADEDPVFAAIRGIKEELGINAGDMHLRMKFSEPTISDPKQSSSYPGLCSIHTKYSLESIIDKKGFKPEGYIERQKDKTTFFKWELFLDLSPENKSEIIEIYY